MRRGAEVAESGSAQPLRILIAEDDEHTRNLLRDLCEGTGYVVELARDGEEALAKLSWGPDLLLLDLTMPRLDGYTVLREVRARERSRELPVIILTAMDDVDGKLKGIELGADDYVTKPFKLMELQSRIRAAVAVRSYRDRVRMLEVELAALRGSGEGSAGAGYARLKAGLEYEMTRARRYGRPLSALVCSIHDFPLLREELGSDDTDRVVTEVRRLLREGLRSPDLLYRMDLEVFVALMPETDTEGAANAACRLVRAVEASGPWPRGRTITLSVGVASFPGEGCENPDELLRAASAAHEASNRKAPGTVVVHGKDELERFA